MSKKRKTENASDIEELSLIELLETDDSPNPLESTQQSSIKASVPGAQAYVNRLLVRIKKVAQQKQLKLTSGLTSHSFRRGADTHANDGSLAENWIIERGGWQLDRVNKAFGYMLGTTQADQNVGRVLSGWSPKEGSRLPSLHALDPPIRDRARALQVLLFANTLAFADSALNQVETVADCLTATVVFHYPDALLLDGRSALVCKMRGVMAEQSIGKAEVLAWSATIRRAFNPPPEMQSSREVNCETSAVLGLVKRQSEQIDVLILQNKRLEDRLLAVEAHFHTHNDRQKPSEQTSVDTPVVFLDTQHVQKAFRPKKKVHGRSQPFGTNGLLRRHVCMPRVLKKKNALYESRHAVEYMLLFVPMGFALHEASAAFRCEVLEIRECAQEKLIVFLKENVSSAIATGTALEILRKMLQNGKLDAHIARYHEQVENGSIIHPTPATALPRFIRTRLIQ